MPTFPHSRITLQVGERRFTTYRRTLIDKSAYFAARIGLEKWKDDRDEVDVNADGSYFIDADPVVFEHILNYLRSGDYPIFFNVDTGKFDYVKYMSLLSQARYFEIHDLSEWIEQRGYLRAVPLRER
ncbi:BTB/POZ protein [Annulohypoxylon truncatum]|uniref:BTB/POZ protein n=1 Tax=Annulohypoxylon truncatum TaxID=327061 RepID=UPI00200864A8|nr:BTB/POZ protein [Annulohypoxylon truncatum]KAI1206209.1 BTB/POZ protein [Annulohypoxylon truncatum]